MADPSQGGMRSLIEKMMERIEEMESRQEELTKRLEEKLSTITTTVAGKNSQDATITQDAKTDLSLSEEAESNSAGGTNSFKQKEILLGERMNSPSAFGISGLVPPLLSSSPL